MKQKIDELIDKYTHVWEHYLEFNGDLENSEYLTLIVILSDLEELKKFQQELIHEVVFKMYCPLVAKGVNKDILKEIAYDLLQQYGIDVAEELKKLAEAKDESNRSMEKFR